MAEHDAALAPEVDAQAMTADQLRDAINEVLGSADCGSMTLKSVRRALAQRIGLPEDGLEPRADEVNTLAKECYQALQPSLEAEQPESPQQRMARVLSGLGNEADTPKQMVYLVTISRVLPDVAAAAGLADIPSMASHHIGEAVRLAFEDPLANAVAGGRPRTRTSGIVKKMVVFKEAHADGDAHFHIAIALTQSRAWAPAKRTLRERDHMASHWSASHSQFWSCVRYGFIPTLKKPAVDPSPWQWTSDGAQLDLFSESQRPFSAQLWKRRREEAVKAAAVTGEKARRFCKLDLTAIIMDKQLSTKAALLEWTQNHGTEEMHIFVHNHQKQLKEFIAEAREWEAAREMAASERETDWALLCRTADGACPDGQECPYAAAACRFFDANKDVLSKDALAVSLRSIIVSGPSKTNRTPLIVGPTNTGKSTLVVPFDNLFGKAKVFHKPALGSSFPLANIMKDKRFLLWDDYRPVEYAQRTIPVDVFLSLFQGFPFELALSGSFHEGNKDFQWNRGAVMTAKDLGLWDVWGAVSEEDARHMQSRVQVFHCVATLPKLKDTDACARCMSRWIRDAADAFDAGQALRPPLPVAQGLVGILGSSGDQQRQDGLGDLIGMASLAQRAHLSPAAVFALTAEVLQLGAVSIDELSLEDWRGLLSWASLRPFEQKRLIKAIDAEHRP